MKIILMTSKKSNCMQQSSDKENKKVRTDKQFKDNCVREGQADNSIYEDSTNSSVSPERSVDKQNKDLEEYIERNGKTKNKS